MKLGFIRLAVFALLFAAVPATFGAAADRKEGQATLLEQNSYPCTNCFFGPSDYYYCFSVDNKIVIAHDRIPTMNWRDPQRNYFGKVYGPWKGPTPQGQTMTVKYDDRYVWMPRADGKEIRLKQDYKHDIFVANAQCRAAVKK
jgi:hypothetical protein